MLTEFVLVAAMAWASDIKTKYWERARRRAGAVSRAKSGFWLEYSTSPLGSPR